MRKSAAWESAFDQASQRPYEYNRQTRERRWSVAADDTSSRAVASEWVEGVDPATGAKYQFNTRTRTSRWSNVDASAAASAAAQSASAVAVSAWEIAIDPMSQRQYEFNRQTRERRWSESIDKSPSAAAADAAVKVIAAEAAAGKASATKSAATSSSWCEAVDPATGRAYQFNARTKESRWSEVNVAAAASATAAAAAESAAAATAAAEWVESVDPATGRSYAYNPRTRESRWSEVDAVAAAAASATAVAAAAENAAAGAEWVESIDPATGRAYEYNARTRESRWSGVDADAAAAASAAAAATATATLSSSTAAEAWETALDPASQRVYEFNRQTRERRWSGTRGSGATESKTTQSARRGGGGSEGLNPVQEVRQLARFDAASLMDAISGVLGERSDADIAASTRTPRPGATRAHGAGLSESGCDSESGSSASTPRRRRSFATPLRPIHTPRTIEARSPTAVGMFSASPATNAPDWSTLHMLFGA